MRKIILALLGITATLVMGQNVAGSLAQCEQICAVDYSKCVINSSDRQTCLTKEGKCANDCKQATEVNNVQIWPFRKGICERCQDAADDIKDEIRVLGCNDKNIKWRISDICDDEFARDHHEEYCKDGFIKNCAKIEQWINEGSYSNHRACSYATHFCA